jgi:ATP-dependent Lhr-like helicase
MSALESFQPAVRRWFYAKFPAGPTEPQALGWPAIARGEHVLIAAPTGSGKTLSAFLVFVDRLHREAAARGAPLFAGGAPEREEGGVDVVYVSPLKALATDIQQNLEAPLAEISAAARARGETVPEIRALVRTGDTSAQARAAMLRRPPHFLITTPESLFLLVTAERSRALLRSVRTIVVDEIHALARDKRGSHLSLTLERLEALCAAPPQRVGLSATQKPIDLVARLLTGRDPASGAPRPCTIVDLGHRRAIDLAIELPESEIEAVASHEQWDEILGKIAAHVESHRTTLVFVNTRRLAERVAHRLAERLGDERVAAHHGSLSKERRLRVEMRLRAGDLSALVATASLELGIDVGPVDLVCQIGSPRSLATFLQRVGRSGHARDRVPKGRLYPATRDELVESAALVRGVCAGRLDRVLPPVAPLDILAQQLVAACAAEAWREDALFDFVRRAEPFAGLARADFDAIVEMLSSGVDTGRGKRGAWLHRDRVNGVLRGRRGARLAALTSGGAIPETFDYKVVLDPDETFLGTVNEDWAVESMAGDIFLLGTHSWRVRRIEPGVVRVVDAGGAPPTVPFWLGEAPARTAELSAEVSALREEVARRLEAGEGDGIAAWLAEACCVDRSGALQIVRYLASAHASLGLLPTRDDLVFERFFDDAGGMQLVVHSVHGGRINRGFGLALRKRFCRSFDFELQAAASDDAVVLSLGPQHSFPLEDATRFLHSGSVGEVLAQALLASPMFAARWRWNLGRALLVLRQRGGKRNPPPIQRMEADDLLAALFPALAACQENQTGPIEIPDHPIVRQTLHDCLHEAADLDGLVALVAGIESGAVRVHCRDTTEPSVLAHEILGSRPYTFLDDAPLEERRTRAVALPRGLPVDPRELGRLDPEAIERVRAEARPEPRDREELHDGLLSLVLAEPEPAHEAWLRELAAERRAGEVETAAGRRWFAAERREAVRALLPQARFTRDPGAVAALAGEAPPDEEAAAVLLVRGWLDVSGPVTARELAARTGARAGAVEIALGRLEGEGFAVRGRFTPDRGAAGEEWCARRLLARIHLGTRERLRREIEPVSAQDLLRFLLRWQHVAPGTQREGRRGLLAVIEQLQGLELAAGAWEESVLSVRVASYRPEWLDDLCLSGEIVWGRHGLRGAEPAADAEEGRGGLVPSRATPIGFALREDLPWLLASGREEGRTPRVPGPGPARDVLDRLEARGALFFRELVAETGRLPIQVEEGLWDLVARGLVTADGFEPVRALLGARERARRTARATRGARARLRGALASRPGGRPEGRWSRIATPPAPAEGERFEPDALAEAVAEQLLTRWGVLFRDLLARETLALPWREVLWALRRMEARGIVRGGRFVAGFVGEQFALPGAVEALRQTRRLERTGEVVRVSGVDPLNLVGVLTPGPRVPALRTHHVTYRDGLPEVASSAHAGA